MHFKVRKLEQITQLNKDTVPIINRLEEMLERAIKNEEYELATKIRDLISQNKEKKLDK